MDMQLKENMKGNNLDLGDSQQYDLKLPPFASDLHFHLNLDSSQSHLQNQNFNSPQEEIKYSSINELLGGQTKTTFFDSFKSESDLLKSAGHKEKKIRQKMILKNVDGLLPNEIYQFSNKKMNVEEIQKQLTQLEKINVLWNEVNKHVKGFELDLSFGDRQTKECSFVLNQSAHQKLNSNEKDIQQQNKMNNRKNTKKSKEKIKSQDQIITSQKPINLGPNSLQFIKVGGVQHQCIENYSKCQTKEISNSTKIKMLKLRKYYLIIKRKINKFLQFKRQQANVQHFHVCRFCGSSFKSGRQLGGHMSRKHQGKSFIYKSKTESYRDKNQQRNRRKRIRKVKPYSRNQNNKKIIKKEEDFICFKEIGDQFIGVKIQDGVGFDDIYYPSESQ